MIPAIYVGFNNEQPPLCYGQTGSVRPLVVDNPAKPLFQFIPDGEGQAFTVVADNIYLPSHELVITH